MLVVGITVVEVGILAKDAKTQRRQLVDNSGNGGSRFSCCIHLGDRNGGGGNGDYSCNYYN